MPNKQPRRTFFSLSYPLVLIVSDGLRKRFEGEGEKRREMDRLDGWELIEREKRMVVERELRAVRKMMRSRGELCMVVLCRGRRC